MAPELVAVLVAMSVQSNELVSVEVAVKQVLSSYVESDVFTLEKIFLWVFFSVPKEDFASNCRTNRALACHLKFYLNTSPLISLSSDDIRLVYES